MLTKSSYMSVFNNEVEVLDQEKGKLHRGVDLKLESELPWYKRYVKEKINYPTVHVYIILLFILFSSHRNNQSHGKS